MANLDCRALKFSKWILPKIKSYHTMKDQDGLTVGYFDFVKVEKIDSNPEPLTGYIETQNSKWQEFALKIINACCSEEKTEELKNLNEFNLTSQQIYAFTNIGVEDLNNAVYDKDKIEKFWEEKSFLRYYSLLHITNATNVDFVKKIIQRINKVFNQNSGKEYHTLCYFSLDYSDIIICSKNHSIQEYSQIIFNLNYNSLENIKIIRDSFSLLSMDLEISKGISEIVKTDYENLIYSDFIRKALNYIEENGIKENYFNEEFFSAFNIGVQDYKVFESAEKKLNEIQIPFLTHKMLGRHDVTITNSKSNLLWLILVQNIIDIFSNKENSLSTVNLDRNNVLFNCESYIRIPFAPYEKFNDQYENLLLEPYYDKAYKKLTTLLQKIDNYSIKKLKPEHIVPILVLNNSILELLKNGFADDFVLCIFEPYINFLEYYIKRCSDDSLYYNDNFDICLNNFFDNINALINSAMHGDRQFIQSPSCNPVFYDVPPKLMAYYTGMTHYINEIIRTDADGDYKYSFMFRPSFSRDIKIKQYSYCDEAPTDRLLTVMINETDLYYPYVVISQICHEVAHYVGDGNRNRLSRKNYFIKCMLYDFAYSFIFEILKSYSSDKPIIEWVDNIFDIISNETLYVNSIEYSYNFINLYYQVLLDMTDNFDKYENAHKKLINDLLKEDLSENMLINELQYHLSNETNNIAFTKESHQISILSPIFSEIYADLQMILVLDLNIESYLGQFVKLCKIKSDIRECGDVYYRVLNIVMFFVLNGEWEIKTKNIKKFPFLKSIFEDINSYICYFGYNESNEIVEDLEDFYKNNNIKSVLIEISKFNKTNKFNSFKQYHYWNYKIQSYLIDSYSSSKKTYFENTSKTKLIEKFRKNVEIIKNFDNAIDVFYNVQNTNYNYAKEIYGG